MFENRMVIDHPDIDQGRAVKEALLEHRIKLQCADGVNTDDIEEEMKRWGDE